MMTDKPVRTAVVTGGHRFDVVNFHHLFQSLEGVQPYIQHMDDFAAAPEEERDSYECVVFYTMLRDGPSDAGVPGYAGKPKTALEHLGATEQGILVLHHAILGYPEWPLWNELVGIDDRSFGYHHEQSIRVETAHRPHPITRGISSWEMVDETYTMADAGTDSEVLLTTRHPKEHADAPAMTIKPWARYPHRTTEDPSNRRACSAFRHSPVMTMKTWHQRQWGSVRNLWRRDPPARHQLDMRAGTCWEIDRPLLRLRGRREPASLTMLNALDLNALSARHLLLPTVSRRCGAIRGGARRGTPHARSAVSAGRCCSYRRERVVPRPMRIGKVQSAAPGAPSARGLIRFSMRHDAGRCRPVASSGASTPDAAWPLPGPTFAAGVTSEMAEETGDLGGPCAPSRARNRRPGSPQQVAAHQLYPASVGGSAHLAARHRRRAAARPRPTTSASSMRSLSSRSTSSVSIGHRRQSSGSDHTRLWLAQFQAVQGAGTDQGVTAAFTHPFLAGSTTEVRGGRLDRPLRVVHRGSRAAAHAAWRSSPSISLWLYLSTHRYIPLVSYAS